jgi:peptidoglycan/xylan/chitin deacetylase (PgdA/CDA1 family)
MFTFRTTTLLFFMVLILLNILAIAGYPIHFAYYLVLAGVYISVSVMASFFICSGFHMRAVCRGETMQKVVALTFDDGPHSGNTPVILDILKDRAGATFFCIGKRIPGNEAILERMAEEGHLVGMHSYSHSNLFDFFSPGRMADEFRQTEDLINKIIRKKPLLFRPPYGVINPMIKKALRSFTYHVIGYSNRSLDTVSRDEEKVLRRVLKNLRPGDIILLHDTLPFAGNLLKKLLHELTEKGYIVIGLNELLQIKAYEE